MRVPRRHGLIAPLLLLMGIVASSGCGVVQDTVDGMTGQASASDPSTSSHNHGSEDLTVTVTVDSDVATSGEISVDIDSPSRSHSLREASVQLPFEQQFAMATDSPFPLRNIRVEVNAGPGATHVECSIIVDGQVVASHRAEGGLAKATCERGLRLGPS